MTLTEVTYYVRKYVPIVVGVSIFLMIVYVVVRFYLTYLEAQKPKPLAIDPLFGRIKRLTITDTQPYPGDATFILDTIEGIPKTATATAKVFFLPPRSPRFGYLSKIYLMAKTLGFNTEVTKHKINNQKATFEEAYRKVTIDIAYFNFTYERTLDENTTIPHTALPAENEIREKTKQFLTTLGRYPDELAQGKENIIYMRYDTETKEFVTVPQKKEANVFEIDFFRGDIDGFPVIPHNYFTSDNFVLGTFKDGNLLVIRAAVQFFEKEEEKVGVYPVKTGDEAWGELLNKQAFVISKAQTGNIVIKKMFLGYLDPSLYESYLQPVYAFLSDDGFVAYVPAISESFAE